MKIMQAVSALNTHPEVFATDPAKCREQIAEAIDQLFRVAADSKMTKVLTFRSRSEMLTEDPYGDLVCFYLRFEAEDDALPMSRAGATTSG